MWIFLTLVRLQRYIPLVPGGRLFRGQSQVPRQPRRTRLKQFPEMRARFPPF